MRFHSWVSRLLVLSLLILLVAGCSREDAPPEDISLDQPEPSITESANQDLGTNVEDADAVAFINGIPVQAESFERAKQQLLSRYQQIYSQIGLETSDLLAGAEGRLYELRVEEEALEMSTARFLIAGELDRRGAAVSDDAVENEFQTKYAQFLDSVGMSEEELKRAFETGAVAGLETGDISFEQFVASTRRTVREELELQAIRQLLAGDLDHSESDLATYFEEHRAEYDIPERVRASQILVSTRTLAEQVLAVLDAGGIFTELVTEVSIDTNTNKRAGDLGWLGRGRMAASFEEAAFGTPVGEVSDIIHSELGFHILLITDYQPAQQPTFDDVRELVISDYEADATAQRFDEWYAEARGSATIVISDPVLAAFRKQKENTDLGLEAFLALQADEQTDEPYLGFIIGTLYEEKMNAAEAARSILQGYMTRTPSQEEELAALELEVRSNRNKAIAAYSAALAHFGQHPEIEARIRRLNPGF